MSATVIPNPRLRADVVIRPLGDDGGYVVKNPRTNEFFQIAEEEHFLLGQINGVQNAEQICTVFEECFGEALTRAELDAFLESAASRGLLEIAGRDLPNADFEGAESRNPKSETNPKHEGPKS